MKNLHSVFLALIMTTLVIGSSYSQTCTSGMISYFKFQETAGPVYTDSKGNHDASGVSSSPVQTQGISGKAQQFSASASNFLSIADHSDFDWAGTTSFSLEFWVKYSGSGSTEVFIGRDDPTTQVHWWIGSNATGKIEWYTRASDGTNGTVVTTASYNNGQWHHVVAVRDAAQGKNVLYVDGTLAQIANVTLSGNLASSAVITIGNLVVNTVPGYYFTGAMDEVAFYNVALPLADITGHYDDVRLYQIGYCSGDEIEILSSSPNVFATVGQQYMYDFDASGNSAPVYSLVEKPAGMTIDPSTGMISWTPATVNVNSHVVVRATNNKGFLEQSFNIFLAEAPECRDNLIAYWDFDQTGGAPYTDNISGFNLTGVGPAPASGIIDGALSFDGVNDSLNLADNLEPEKIFFDWDDVPSFTIELWMKSNASPSQTMVLVGRDEEANNSQFWLGVNTDGTAGFFLADYGSNQLYITGGSSVLDGEWHHLVGTYDAATDLAKLYVDMVLVDDISQALLNIGSNNPLNIGCMNTPIDKFWYTGLIDELAFYSTALSQATITSNYNDVNAGKGGCVYNYAPVIVSSPDTVVNEDSPYYYKLVSTDVNQSDVITISAVTKPAWLTFTYVATDTFAVLSGIADNTQVGKHNVTLRVTDGSVQVDQTFQIRVQNVNDGPAFTSTPIILINEDVSYSYTAVASDPDGDDLTFSASVKPEWLDFDPETQILSGVPSNDEVGVFDVTLSVTDGTVSVDQVFEITVSNVNDLPEFTSDPILSVNANLTYMYEVTATDVDEGDVLTYSVDSKPEWLDFTAGATSGILTGTPTQAEVGSHAIILKVNDGHVDVMQGFTLTVLPPSALEDIDNSLVLNAYPNPASDKVYFVLARTGKAKIEIYDLSGTLQRTVHSEGDKAEVDVSALSNGLYIYKLYQDNKVSIGKITKN